MRPKRVEHKEGRANTNAVPPPPADMIAMATNLLRLCDERLRVRTGLGVAEAAYLRTQKEIASAERGRDHDAKQFVSGALRMSEVADTIERLTLLRKVLSEAEQQVVELRARLPALEAEIRERETEFAPAVTAIVRPLKAQAAGRFRDAIGEAKRARDEFAQLSRALAEPARYEGAFTAADLENGLSLAHGREEPTPIHPEGWSTIRRALMAAFRSETEH